MAIKAGTAYVELTLDDKVYKQRLSEQLTSTQATAKGIETSWRTLGAKSDEYYNAQRRSYENALTLIKNSTTATHADIVRAEKAKNEQITRLNEQQFGKQTSLLESAKKHWMAYAAAVGTVYYGLKSTVNASLQMERITSTMNAVTGSATGTADAMSFVREASNRLGLQLDNTALSYGKFMAASRNTSLEGEGTRQVFIGVSEAVSAMKLPAEQAEGIFLALSQMLSKGKVQAEELRGQLGERLPGAFRLAAEAMGVTTAELDKMLKDGDVMAEDLLPKLAVKLHETYGTAAVEAAKGGQAAINRFNNAVFESKTIIGDAVGTTIYPALNLWAEGVAILTKRFKEFMNPTDLDVMKKQEDALKEQVKTLENFQKAPAGKWGDYSKEIEQARRELAIIQETIRKESAGFFSPPATNAGKALPPSNYAPAGTSTGASTAEKIADEARKRYTAEVEALDRESEYYLKVSKDYADAEAKKTASAKEEAEKRYKAEVEALDAESEYWLKVSEEQRKAAEKTAEAGQDRFADLETAIEGWGRDSADAIVQFAITGKLSFKEMVESMIADLARMAIYENITKNLFGTAAKLIGGIAAGTAGGAAEAGASAGGALTWTAKGGVFSDGSLIPFARGGVVSGPTMFPMAAGAGIMGEAGPEAVMPLTRLPSGDLGVRAQGQSGGGSEGPVNIFINANDAKSFNDMCRRNPAAITEPILQALRDNKIRGEFKRLVT